MRWVHRNAKGLNIDPALVTIFGESAGAADTTAHLSAPRSQGLFTRAAMESGNNCPWASHALSTASAQFDALAIALKCPPGAAAVACMRKINATELCTAAHNLPVKGGLTDWAAVVDGVELNVTLMNPSSAISKVPVLLGTNRDEGTEFTKCKTTANQTDLDEWMGATGQLGASPEQVAQLKVQYPPTRYSNTTFATAEWWASVRMVGDYAMTCPARRTARHHAAASANPVWLYFFDHKPLLVNAIEAFTKKPMGVLHGSELVFVFGQVELLDTAERKLAEEFQLYWTNFAKYGDPNGPPGSRTVCCSAALPPCSLASVLVSVKWFETCRLIAR